MVRKDKSMNEQAETRKITDIASFRVMLALFGCHYRLTGNELQIRTKSTDEDYVHDVELLERIMASDEEIINCTKIYLRSRKLKIPCLWQLTQVYEWLSPFDERVDSERITPDKTCAFLVEWLSDAQWLEYLREGNLVCRDWADAYLFALHTQEYRTKTG